VEKALRAHGFVVRESGDRIFTLWADEKKQPIQTKTSHGAEEIANQRINDMAYQIGLSKPEFLAFVEGRLDSAGYLALLRRKGLI
jgi:hypothetical protein